MTTNDIVKGKYKILNADGTGILGILGALRPSMDRMYV